MSSDDDMPLARANGHCKSFKLIFNIEVTPCSFTFASTSGLIKSPSQALLASTLFAVKTHSFCSMDKNVRALTIPSR
jgi:hypothetical protein